MKKILLSCFIGVFFALCLMPGLGLLTGVHEELMANQIPVPEPRLLNSDGSANPEFFSDFQDYFESRYAFKQRFVTAYSAIQAVLFKTSNTNQVILGRDGWLFYQSTAGDYLNIPNISERQAANVAISLSLIQEYFRNHGTEFLLAVALNKNSVYPQYMPLNYRVLNRDGTAELIIRALEREGVNYTKLLAEFREQEEELYHKLDSHWNNRGAALAQLQIMQELGLSGTDYSETDYRTVRDFRGDLYEMLYPLGTELDFNQYYDAFTYQFDGLDITDTETLTYSAYNLDKEYSLLMYRDSFGNALLPFMAQEFGKSFFTRAVPYELGLASTVGADFAVIEIAERNMNTFTRRAPVMEAPVRDITLPDNAIYAELNLTARMNDAYVMVSGSYNPALSDIGTRVYAAVTQGTQTVHALTTVYEATPAGEGGEGVVTLYLPLQTADTLEISLILTCCGETVITEAVTLYP